jgi:hypothetical protein
MTYEKLLESLQRSLAQIDLINEPRRRAPAGFTEFLVLKLKNIKIKMYQEKGHSMPHIHIDYGKENHVASFSIEPPRRINGSLNSKYDREIISWVTANKEALLKIWSEAQAGGNPSNLIAQLKGNA